LPADTIISDLEDGVAPDAKDEVRQNACTDGSFGRTESLNGLEDVNWLSPRTFAIFIPSAMPII
jgi:citrate lyase beta subunit